MAVARGLPNPFHDKNKELNDGKTETKLQRKGKLYTFGIAEA